MTHTYNIAAINGNALIPVLTENGSLIAYIQPADSREIPQELPGFQGYRRAIAGLLQGIPLNYYYHKDAFGCTGQPIIQSPLKIRTMEKTTSSNGLTAERIKNDPAFERTRENSEEFTRAVKAAKLLRDIFRDVTVNAKDIKTHNRLTTAANRVIQSDPINERGKRTVTDGDPRRLKGFNFNQRAGIRDVLFVKCPVSFNRVSGELTVTIPSFVPASSTAPARGATHFRIMAAATAVNFETEEYEYDKQTTAELPLDNNPTLATTLTLALPANSTDIVVAALGIEFYQKVNGKHYELKSGDHIATTIVLVDKAA
jgi:hypothetical protein